MLRKIKSFFIGAFRKVKNIWNRIWGKKTMANYLLECEIVGGEIANLLCKTKITVRPQYTCCLPGKSKGSYAILSSEDEKNLKLVELSEEKTVDFYFGIGAFPKVLVSRNYSAVVLEIAIGNPLGLIVSPNDLKVVGFKAQF